MKKTYIYGLICLLICSCTGGFDPTENAFITLKAPINKCEEGSLNSDSNLLNVDFKWQIANGTFTEGEIVLLERLTEEEIRRIPVQDINSLIQQQVSLEPGKWFKWQIEAIPEGYSEPIKSDLKEFYSELIFEDAAPYPVIITELLNTSNNLEFEWEHPQEDPNGNNLKYVVFYTYGESKEGVAIPNLQFRKFEDEFSSSSPQKRINISADEFEPGSTQYLKVQSIVTLSNVEFSSNTYFKFITK
ncbi:hypothetical protein BFP77_09360 [Maribacter sp. 4U21]|uniref:hypothetical protein n=1 Tax=Maribacter sp. 4U21 TaxID=1889779 RepID=UPI000C14C1AC|nr:hypothetical protein [Maribacter sp. 4U21]PIB28826.1 hypothetical protein BFP77_09360 [Maribacter sp. 4U21]